MLVIETQRVDEAGNTFNVSLIGENIAFFGPIALQKEVYKNCTSVAMTNGVVIAVTIKPAVLKKMLLEYK